MNFDAIIKRSAVIFDFWIFTR